MSGLSRALGRAVLSSKRSSPHIFFGLGLVGVIGGAVLACRATLKAGPILEEMKEEVDNIKVMSTPETAQADTMYAYSKGVAQLAMAYSPAVVVTGLGIAALTGSHVSLARRNSALMAAYASLSAAYKKFYSPGDTLVKYDEANRAVSVYEYGQSPFRSLFDEYNENWTKDPEQNLLFLSLVQRQANAKLESRGWVFLNEVYSMLGLEPTREGSVVGWLYPGDICHIDFGIPEYMYEGNEPSCWLEFNVDGVIFDEIKSNYKRGYR